MSLRNLKRLMYGQQQQKASSQLEPIAQTGRESAMEKTMDQHQDKTISSDQQQASFVYEDKPVKKATTDYSSVEQNNVKPYESSKQTLFDNRRASN